MIDAQTDAAAAAAVSASDCSSAAAELIRAAATATTAAAASLPSPPCSSFSLSSVPRVGVLVVGSGPASLSLLLRVLRPGLADLWTDDEAQRGGRRQTDWHAAGTDGEAGTDPEPEAEAEADDQGAAGGDEKTEQKHPQQQTTAHASSRAKAQANAKANAPRPSSELSTQPIWQRSPIPSMDVQRVRGQAHGEWNTRRGAELSSAAPVPVPLADLWRWANQLTVIPRSMSVRLIVCLPLFPLCADSILVVDPLAGGWCGAWQRNFAALRIDFLRSTVLAHPCPEDPQSLRAFAARRGRSHELRALLAADSLAQRQGKELQRKCRKDQRRLAKKVQAHAAALCAAQTGGVEPPSDLAPFSPTPTSDASVPFRRVTQSAAVWPRAALFDLTVPSSGLFNSFTAALVKQWKLDQMRIKDRVVAIRRVR